MKTTLDQKEVKSRRFGSIASTFVLASAMLLSGCGDPNDYSNNEWNVEQTNGENAKLVQGREACEQALRAQGKTESEARYICDDATPYRAANGNYAHSGGGNSNAALWYMIGRNSSTVSTYEGHPDTGLRQVGGYRGAYTPSYMGASKAASSSHGATSRGGFSPSHGFGFHGG
ncbi:MAG: hypothetical protein DI551_06535 [Micavibrio aeruginosavorus]|uniref:DUF1190 domain-containing protein n=1 Tax=Micavibrio aeruginosavorus TaxID=349221 RepID=A0A2W5PTH5_9BACT|nr:MAG: hypothetical protein DI551_06535 [Micavibrio aeruginosavorus]